MAAGDTRSQGISSNDTDVIFPQGSCLSTRRVISLRPSDLYIDDLVQDCSISSALAMEIHVLQSCTKPSIYIGKLSIITSDNGSAPGQRQAIICTNAGILLIGLLGTNLSEILIKIYTFSCKEKHLKLSSGKWLPFCLGFNMLTQWLFWGLVLPCNVSEICNHSETYCQIGLSKKLWWNALILIQENSFENVCKMSFILFRLQCINP